MKRKTVYIDDNLYETITVMAKNKKWSFSKMNLVLLQQAVKEKTRKNKGAKQENTPEHNTTNPR